MGARTQRRGIRCAGDHLERRDLLATVLPMVVTPISAQAGTSFSGVVGGFFDPRLGDTVGDFTVTINWGDQGPTSPGTVVQLSPTLFQIDASHTYADPGSFTTGINVVNQAGDKWVGAGVAAVSAAAAPSPLTIAANNFKGLAGTATTATVAAFIDPNTADTTSDFNALISWGDGHSSTGTLAGGDGSFTVVGTNTYSAAGTYTFTVTVEGDGLTSSTTGTATIATSSPFTFADKPVFALPGVPQTYTVAGFTDTNPGDAGFTALINWGDGSSTAAGTVTPISGGFAVQGTHAYLNPGTYPIGVTIYNASGQSGSTSTTATVLNSSPVGAVADFTGALAATGDGPNAAGGFSNTNRPTFSGSAPPYSVVQLFAQRIDIDATLPLGQAVASGTGQWTLATGPLADGIYDVTAVVTPAGGYPGPSVPLTANNGQVVIDSTGPRVVAVTPFDSAGEVLVTLQAGYSGMNELSLLDPANYTFVGPRGLRIHPVAVAPLPAGIPTSGTESVVLLPSANPRLRRQITSLSIAGAGITDMAGNPLQGGSYGLTATQARHPAVIQAVHRSGQRVRR